MEKIITNFPNLKEIEQLLWRELQETYSKAMKKILEEMDQQIAEERDKKRFRLLEKRKTHIDSLFGQVEVKRNYYRDREKEEYVYLLDRYLEFEGAGHFSPLIEEVAIELAISGPAYRKAAEALESLLGYRVISHETIRQHLIQSISVPKATKEPVNGPVLFVEVDGLYIKRQEKRKRGKEEKIAAVHQGWIVNGKRVSLKGKRHFIHQGKEPFWEAFEEFLIENFEYDPTVHKLIINGDGANWITSCREHFKGRAFFTIDRFHVAREIRSLFREHPRYRSMQKALAEYDGEKLLVEMNSAVGTLETDIQEERLMDLIKQLEKYPEALGDYREWLREQGIRTEGMRSMGSAEGTMNVFAKRLKNGRSWVETGIQAMTRGMIAYLDGLPLKTLFGRVEKWSEEKTEQKAPKHYVEKIKNTVGEATRGNIPYLNGKVNTPIYQALTALAGF